jgi:site-specific recombinase XerD
MTHPAAELHWAAFQRRLMTKRRSDLTIKSYRVALDDLLGVHADADPADLTQTDLEEWMLDALGRLAPSTVAIRFRSLRAFFNFLVDEEVIEGRSPMARLSEPKGDDVPPAILTDEQIRELLKVCDGKAFEDRRDTAIIRLFCEPGSPRVAEMAGILVSDLDMGREASVTVTGKGNKTRTFPIGSKTGTALDRYLRLRSKHRLGNLPHLWLGGRGAQMTASGITQMISRRAVQSGIGHVHPHQFRHSAAHAAKTAGFSDEQMMVLFGWSSSEMPRRYGRSATTARAHAAARRASLGDRL